MKRIHTILTRYYSRLLLFYYFILKFACDMSKETVLNFALKYSIKICPQNKYYISIIVTIIYITFNLNIIH